jgi:hypothetical protein
MLDSTLALCRRGHLWTATLGIVLVLLSGAHAQFSNASCTVVGLYYDINYVGHGFIYNKGQWATLDFPLGSFTTLLGISNAGVILGASDWGFFFYANGQFEVLPSVPNSTGTAYYGLSLGGLFTGIESDSTGQHGFVASCKGVARPIPKMCGVGQKCATAVVNF